MKTITISIPNACSQKWENFSHSTEGRFCSSCCKTVVDFTKMSDDEIVSYFQNKHGHTCGRFAKDQLKSYSILTTSRVNPGFTLLKAGLLGMFLIIGSNASFGQVKTNPVETVQTPQATATSKPEKTYSIKGVVKSSEDSLPLPGVNIFLKNDVSVGTVSDADGHFEFPKKLKEGDMLIFSFIGMETQEYKVPALAINEIDIKLNIDMAMSCYITMGAVAVDEVYSEPKGVARVWQKIKSIF